MKILLTGSGGFIGGNILTHFGKKYSFLYPSHDELDLLDEEKTLEYFKKHPVDLVIHCAVIGGSRVEQYEKNMFFNNTRIFFNIVRCQQYYKRMINIGSGAEYDKRFPISNVKEEDIDKRVPVDEYGFYKYVCAQYINTADNIVDLRVFGMFGEGEDYRYRFISNAICRSILGQPITMNQDVYFDYMDILDFMHIIDFFIHHTPKYKAYNIGTGKIINIKTIAEKVSMLGAKKAEIRISKSGLNNEYSCNTNRLFQELPNLKFRSIDESIQRLYIWYSKRSKTISAAMNI